MNKLLFFCFALLSAFQSLPSTDDITGFWKTVDDKTGKAQSVVAIYEHKGKYCGRLIVTYRPDGTVKDTLDQRTERAPGVKGEPYYAGLDFIWGLQKEGSKYVNGKIMDPQKGKIYDAELWVQDGNLIVRGKILFIGRNQTWPAAKDSDFPPNFSKPDLTAFVPVIPQRKLR